MSKNGVTLSVSWGNDAVYVELTVPSEEWLQILSGEACTIEGSGYSYEGEEFQDYWDFGGGIDGELIIRYGLVNDWDESGQGFIGTARDALHD